MKTFDVKTSAGLILCFPIVCFVVAAVSVSAAQTPPSRTPAAFPKPALFAPGIVSTPDFQFNAAFTPDGNTAFFSNSDPGFKRITIVF